VSAPYAETTLVDTVYNTASAVLTTSSPMSGTAAQVGVVFCRWVMVISANSRGGFTGRVGFYQLDLSCRGVGPEQGALGLYHWTFASPALLLRRIVDKGKGASTRFCSVSFVSFVSLPFFNSSFYSIE
jgi:hypothetical protein